MRSLLLWLVRDLISVGRRLGRDVADDFIVKLLGFFSLVPGGAGGPVGAVCGLHEGSDQVYGYRQDYGRVLLRGYLAHRLKQPQLEGRRTFKPVGGLPESL